MLYSQYLKNFFLIHSLKEKQQNDFVQQVLVFFSSSETAINTL